MEGNILIESSKTKAKPAKSEDKKSGGKPDKKPGGKPEQSYKFENYFDKKMPQKYIKPHQVSATHTNF